MWIGIISTIIAMIMLVWAVNLSLLWAFVVGGVIIAFIVLFAQTSKADERITMLEINNQRLLSRIDLMMDKIESKNLANLAKDSQKSVESSAESKNAEFCTHINESPTKPRESTFQSFESPRHKAEFAESTKSTQSKTTTDSPQHINATNPTNGANSTNTAFSFEQFLAQKAMIILGGIFFVLAAYFCIKYAIEHNFLTPQVRIAGAMCFGALLFAIGFALDRFDRFAHRSVMSARIAQTLIGVASVVEFFAIYGGYALYGFFGEVLSFALLCFVVLKVFFVDTNSFSSLGKVALFVFMGVAFIGIAALYNRFVLKRKSR